MILSSDSSRGSPAEKIPLVSDHVKDDIEPRNPTYARHYDVKMPVQLADLQLYENGHPWDGYKFLRENAPVAWHEEQNFGSGYWSIVDHADIRAVELDTKTFSSQVGGINLNYGAPETRHPDLYQAALNTMICLDQPLHMPLRREHMPFFTPNYVEGLREKVAGKVDALLDGFEGAGPTFDFVSKFAAQLPMFTLCEMLGIPEDDRPQLIEWMHHLEMAADTLARRGIGGIEPEFLMSFLTEMTNLFAYGRTLLNERRDNPKEDLLSAIARAQINGELLPQAYLDGSWLLILFAGNDTTRNSLSGTIRLLTQFPEQRQKLIANPDLLSGSVNEAIRMVSPVIYMRRTATRDVVIRDQKIAAGEKVVMYYGAANRDPAVFENPDSFDISRSNAEDHLAFGIGPHVCLGKRIAILQLETSLSRLMARFPDIHVSGKVEMAPNNFVHAISRLDVSLNSG